MQWGKFGRWIFKRLCTYRWIFSWDRNNYKVLAYNAQAAFVLLEERDIDEKCNTKLKDINNITQSVTILKIKTKAFSNHHLIQHYIHLHIIY